MHSRIFEISHTPIAPEEYLKEYSIPDWFCGAIADYVDEDTDRKSDIEWLLQYLKGAATYSEEDSSLIFQPNAKKKAFSANYIAFRESLNALLSVSEEVFSGESHDQDLSMMMYRLKEAYSNEFGFYIYSHGWGLRTLDEWLRDADLSKKYYIGGTLDYHF